MTDPNRYVPSASIALAHAAFATVDQRSLHRLISLNVLRARMNRADHIIIITYLDTTENRVPYFIYIKRAFSAPTVSTAAVIAIIAFAARLDLVLIKSSAIHRLERKRLGEALLW